MFVFKCNLCRCAEGCFEVNPPFEEALVLRCAKHMGKLLDAAAAGGRRLSFAAVTPHWPGRRAWEALAGSPHATHVEVTPLRGGAVRVVNPVDGP
jgi:hypothetical protein